MDWVSWFCVEDRQWLIDVLDQLIQDRVDESTIQEFYRRIIGQPYEVSALQELYKREDLFPSQTIACIIFVLLSQGNILGIWNHFNVLMSARVSGDIKPNLERPRDAMDAFSHSALVWCTTTVSAKSNAVFLKAVKTFFQ